VASEATSAVVTALEAETARAAAAAVSVGSGGSAQAPGTSADGVRRVVSAVSMRALAAGPGGDGDGSCGVALPGRPDSPVELAVAAAVGHASGGLQRAHAPGPGAGGAETTCGVGASAGSSGGAVPDARDVDAAAAALLRDAASDRYVHDTASHGTSFAADTSLHVPSPHGVASRRIVGASDRGEPASTGDGQLLASRSSRRLEGGPHWHIVVVDDADTIRLLLRRGLQRGLPGCTVHLAADGKQALEVYDRLCGSGLAPVAVCMDSNMPVMTGNEAVRLLRCAPRSYGGLIVGITGNALARDQAAFVAAGCDAVLTKPVAMETLVPMVVAAHGRSAGCGASMRDTSKLGSIVK